MKNINRVLCVEDNSEKYMAVNRFLRSQDVYKIDWATNAEKAQKLKKQAKERAITARTDYIKRVKEGVSYEKE